MGNVIRSEQFERDLAEIVDFIALVRHAPAAAEAVADETSRSMEAHARQPTMGELRTDLGEGLRSFVVKRNYVVVYRPLPDGIEVLRVFHAARDYGRFLGES